MYTCRFQKDPTPYVFLSFKVFLCVSWGLTMTPSTPLENSEQTRVTSHILQMVSAQHRPFTHGTTYAPVLSQG
jgi:hypothetical protein